MSVSSSQVNPISQAYREPEKEEEKEVVKGTCYCWPCCPRPKKRSHERALTQHELDYARILKIEAAQKKALDKVEKK